MGLWGKRERRGLGRMVGYSEVDQKRADVYGSGVESVLLAGRSLGREVASLDRKRLGDEILRGMRVGPRRFR